MANKIKGLTIQIGADTLGLDKALSSIETASRKATSELKEIERAISKVPDSAELWKQKQELLNTALDKSKEKVKLLETSQKSMQDRLRDGDIDRQAYDKFREKLTKSREALEKLKDKQTEMQEKLSRGEIDQGAYDKFMQKVEKAETEVRKLEAAEHSMEENLRLGNISEEQYRAFQRELETARADCDRLSGQLDDTRQQINRLGDGSSDAADDVDELGDELTETGDQARNTAENGISAMTVALGNLVADGIKLAADKLKDFTEDVVRTGSTFEAAMSSVGAISGATASEMEILTAKAEEMGASTKYTAAESAQAFQYMAMAGWKAEDMVSGIEGVLSLAAASGEELGTTSDIVTDAMTAFGLSADQAGHFADVLAAASSNANTNVSMMGETFKYVAPVAGAMNYSIEDMAEMIGTMANSGIKATNSGTALRSIITRLSTDAGATAKKLGALGTLTEKLGVQFYEADGSARDFGDVIAETREKWKGLTDQQQTSYGKTIAGTNALSGWLALMNAAPADVDKLTTAIENCDGAATDMSTTMIDNLSGDMTILGSAVDGMKIKLSKLLTPALRDTVKYMTDSIPDIQKKLEPVFKKGGEFISFAVQELPKVIDRAKTLLPVVEMIGAAFLAWQVTDKIVKFGEAIKTGTTLMQALNITMAANPAVAVTAAVVGLTAACVALYKAQENELSIEEQVNEQFLEQTNAVNDTRDAMNQLKDDYNNRAADTKKEFDRVEDLWKELDKLTDANGRVKKADEERVNYILGELNSALGTEYSLTGNQIQNYQNLAAEIDNVIAKKKAEAYLDDYLALASGMAQQAAESKKQYEEADAQRTQSKAEWDEAENEYQSAVKEWESVSGLYSKDETGAKNYLEAVSVKNPEVKAKAQKVVEAAQKREEAKKTYEVASSNANIARADYKESLSYNAKLKQAQTAMSEGNYEDVEKILYDIESSVMDIENMAEDELPQAFSKGMEKVRSDIKLTISAGSQEAVNEFLIGLEDAWTVGAKAGKKTSDVFTKEVRDGIQKMLDGGFDISELSRWAKEKGIKVSDVFEENFTDVVQKQLDKGYDITALMEWGMNSGIDIADEFKDTYTDIVQKQLDEGYDIDMLLKWGYDTGALTSDQYADIFRQNVSNKLGEGFDTARFDDWLRQYAEDSGNIYGATFKDVWTRYLYDPEVNPGMIPHNINSESDAELYRKGLYHAFGGYINDEGIVAENGPELIRVENGAVRVVPLNRMAKNTAVSKLTAEKVGSYYDGGNNSVWNGTDNTGTDIIRPENNVDSTAKGAHCAPLQSSNMLNENTQNNSINNYYSDNAVHSYNSAVSSFTRDVSAGAYIIRPENNEDSIAKGAQCAPLQSSNTLNENRSAVSVVNGTVQNNVPFLANGGFLSSGSAVVGEVGPELLQIMNGGALVTPIARQTAESNQKQEHVQKLFYNEYNVNANISGGYDITRLAEELAAEQRRIEEGKGL